MAFSHQDCVSGGSLLCVTFTNRSLYVRDRQVDGGAEGIEGLRRIGKRSKADEETVSGAEKSTTYGGRVIKHRARRRGRRFEMQKDRLRHQVPSLHQDEEEEEEQCCIFSHQHRLLKLLMLLLIAPARELDAIGRIIMEIFRGHVTLQMQRA